MPTICVTVSAADQTRIVNALSVRFGYSATLADGSANPQTAGEFVRQRIGAWIRTETRAHELATAQAAVTVTDVAVS